MAFSYGDVVYANLDPSAGHEQTKRRPLIVMSNDRFNGYCNLTFVCPVTHADTGYRLHANVGPIRLGDGTCLEGFAAVEQTKSLDLEARDAVKVGHVPDTMMLQLSDLLLMCLMRDDQMLLPTTY